MADRSLTIVTGASSNHFGCLCNLLESIARFEPQARAIVYDLGLKPQEASWLEDNTPRLRKFEFSRYPPHVNIRIDKGYFAWKPIIMASLLREFSGMVLWLDAGNLVHAPLEAVKDVLSKNGVYSPTSSGTVARWTHPATLKCLGAGFDLLRKPNRNGAIVGFRADHPGVDALAEKWETCALDKRCIAPTGSDRQNHRWDQALLTVLMYQFQRQSGCQLENERLGISTHNDRLSPDEARRKNGAAGAHRQSSSRRTAK